MLYRSYIVQQGTLPPILVALGLTIGVVRLFSGLFWLVVLGTSGAWRLLAILFIPICSINRDYRERGNTAEDMPSGCTGLKYYPLNVLLYDSGVMGSGVITANIYQISKV